LRQSPDREKTTSLEVVITLQDEPVGQSPENLVPIRKNIPGEGCIFCTVSTHLWGVVGRRKVFLCAKFLYFSEKQYQFISSKDRVSEISGDHTECFMYHWPCPFLCENFLTASYFFLLLEKVQQKMTKVWGNLEWNLLTLMQKYFLQTVDFHLYLLFKTGIKIVQSVNSNKFIIKSTR
jgi:hypothetical protein